MEKVFSRKEEQAEKTSGGAFGSSENKRENIIFFDQPLAVGQKWQTKDGRFALTIREQKKEGSGRFVIVFKDVYEKTMEEQMKSEEELKEMLISGEYDLISGPVEAISKTAPLEAVPEEVERNTHLEVKEEPVAPIVSEKEKSPLSDKSVKKIVNLDDLRASVPPKPAEQPMGSPFMKTPERKTGTSSKESIEEVANIEEKIGKEKYEALTQFVEGAWKNFEAGLKDKKILKRVWNKIWKTETIPYLGKRIEVFLREQTELGPDEYEAVRDSLIQKISEKK